MTKIIVGFGEALVDVLPSGEVVGGAPLNFSVRAAQLAEPLGWKAALISRIGSDARGEKISQHLQQTALDTAAIQVDSQRPTGFVDVQLDHGHPSYEIGQQVAWDHIAADATALRLAREASAFCFGTLAQRGAETTDTLFQCLEAAEHAVKIFDINLRKPYPAIEIITNSLQRADVLKCNGEELLLLADWLQLPHTSSSSGTANETAAHAQDIATILQSEFKLACVFWTQGAQGCVLQRGPRSMTAAVPQLPQAADADSVGAGDAASAALAIGLVAGWDDAKIVSVANYCGAFAASQRGATAPFPADFLKQL